MNSPWGDQAVLVRRWSAMAVLATALLGGGMADGIVVGERYSCFGGLKRGCQGALRSVRARESVQCRC